MFPHVALDPDVLFVDDPILTSAGAASGVDVCLHVVRKDHGSRLANTVARRCVVPPFQDGGQAQYVEQPVPENGAVSALIGVDPSTCESHGRPDLWQPQLRATAAT